MNPDCIFSSLLFCDLATIHNFFKTNKQIKLEYPEYLWKLLYERDYDNILEGFFEGSFYEKYKSCHVFRKLHGTSYKFQELINSKEIRIYGAGLVQIPSELGILKNLEHLYLQFDRLKCIPSQFGNLINLKTIILRSNSLKNVPSELGKLTCLEILCLSENMLMSVPTELGYLINLGGLYMSNNKLEFIPSELGQLINLRNLNISTNKITRIPTEFSRLINLTEFNMNTNKIAYIPTEICVLTNLNYLHIANNKLETIPKEISQLTDLRGLNISCNSLTNLPIELWGIDFNYIDISKNHIKYLPSEFLDHDVTCDGEVRFLSIIGYVVESIYKFPFRLINYLV